MVVFFKKVARKLYYTPKKILGELLFGANKVLNDGERFDPFLSSFQYADKCHLPRYEFASELIEGGDEVLDIACGTGYGSRMMAYNAKKVTGVDISHDAIAYAKEKADSANLNYVESDFFRNKIEADIVVSFETIEHIQVDDFESILHSLASYAKKKIIASVPYMEAPNANPHHYFFNLNEDSVKVLGNYGNVGYFYQSADGVITSEKPTCSIQNLIVVVDKFGQ